MNPTKVQLNPVVRGPSRVGSAAAPSRCERPEAKSPSFRAVLDQELAQQPAVHFSAHARERIATRDIPLAEHDLPRIERAVDQAAAKGARNALLVADDFALIVNVPHRTVVTALGRGQMAQHVVTNIDSTVWMEE
jgi:flagellar operon protein